MKPPPPPDAPNYAAPVSHFHSTQFELAVLVPVGVVLGAAVGAIGQLVAGRINRKAAEAERIWNSRSRIYVQIANANFSVWSVLSGALEDESYYAEAHRLLAEVYTRKLMDLKGEFSIFSGKEVEAHFIELINRAVELEEALRPAASGTEPPPERATIDHLYEAALDSRKAFDNAMRVELGTGPLS